MFIEVPHEFVFHDELINPRGINTLYGERIERCQEEHGISHEEYSFSEMSACFS